MIVIGSSQQIPFYQNTTGAAEITLITDAPEDGIDEICIFHNGGIVNLITRNLIVTDNRKSKSMTKKYTINLLPGSKNLLQSWPELPELMKKYSGTLQYPASYGFGNDFPVEVLK